MLRLLSQCWGSVGHRDHVVEDSTPALGNRFVSVDHRTGIEIDVVLHPVESGGVAGELDDRADRIADGRSPAGRKDHDVTTRRHDSWGCFLVVARALHEPESIGGRGRGVIAAPFYSPSAGLGEGAEALDRDVEESTRLVPGAGIVVETSPENSRVLFVPVNELIDLAPSGGVLRPPGEDMLGTAELRNLSNDRSAT